MLKKKTILSIASAGIALAGLTGSALTASADTQGNSTQPTVQKHGHHKGGFSNQALLSLLKIDANTLKQDLKAGQSLADIASTQGVSEQDVINLLVQQSTQRIDKSVTSGKLTQDKATQMESKLPDRVKKMVEHKGGFAPVAQKKKHQDQGQLKQVATLLGMDQKQLASQLKAGKSIADIAAAQGKDEQTIINQLVTQATQKIDQAVSAGKLTQEKADTMKSKLPDRIKKFVEQKGFGKKSHGQHQRTSAQTNSPSQSGAQ